MLSKMSESLLRCLCFYLSILACSGAAGCLKALAGRTYNVDAATVLDSDTFIEAAETAELNTSRPLAENWYNSFKIVALYSLGHYAAAVELGFKVWEMKAWSSSHHHVSISLPGLAHISSDVTSSALIPFFVLFVYTL